MALLPDFEQLGDLIFFLKDYNTSNNDFVNAVGSSSKIDSRVFHVAIIVDSFDNIVHAVPKKGVIFEPLSAAFSTIKPDLIEIYRVDVPLQTRKKAVEFVISQIGSAYNDIFSPNCINSNGKKSYYCCQLICHAFGHRTFLSHTLDFTNSQGDILPYWIKYYDRLNHSIPQGKPGSQPSVLKASPVCKLRSKRFFTVC